MRSVALLGSLLLSSLLAACGGDGNTGGTMNGAQPGVGGATSSPVAGGGGRAAAPAGAASAGNSGTSPTGAAGMSSPSSSSTAPSGNAGSSTAGAPAGTAGSAAGVGAAGAAPAVAMGNKECNGKPWPARAQNGYGPYAVGPETAGLAPYWPTADWKMEDPAKLGFDTAKLMAAVDYTTGGSSNQAVLIIRHGYIAAEKYYGGFSQSTQHESFSVAKSFSSGLIGIAIAENKIPNGLDARICEYYPDQWDCNDMNDPRSRITIDHAMNLKTGLQWEENWRSDSTGLNDGLSSSLDTVLARMSVEEPGVRQRYSTGDPALLSGVIQKATGMTALAYAKAKVFDVIGTPDIRWGADSQGRTTTYAGLSATAREYAKYGYLYLNKGMWDGKQVIPEDYVVKTTQVKMPCNEWVQYLWHVNPPYRLGPQPDNCDALFCEPSEYANLPQDGFFAEGVQGQFIYVIPSADLVAVRLAQDGFMSAELWDDYSRGFLAAVLDAINP